MCQETIHWRICGHHTSSWQFCQHFEADHVVVPDPTTQQMAKTEDPTIQELRDQLAQQSLETINLSLYFDDDENETASPPTSPPPLSTTSSSSDDDTSPPSSPVSPTSTPDTSDAAPKSSSTQTEEPPASSFFLSPVSAQEVYEPQPCSFTYTPDDYSRYHDPCKHPDSCDYERVNRQWTCCGCGRGPHRGTVCHRTIDDAIAFGHEVGKDECGHFLCASCSPCVLPPIPVYNPDIMDWA